MTEPVPTLGDLIVYKTPESIIQFFKTQPWYWEFLQPYISGRVDMPDLKSVDDLRRYLFNYTAHEVLPNFNFLESLAMILVEKIGNTEWRISNGFLDNAQGEGIINQAQNILKSIITIEIPKYNAYLFRNNI